MRKVVLNDSDFAMFDNDIRQEDYDFYQRHRDAFRRMWVEQVRRLLPVFHGYVRPSHMKFSTQILIR